jgi:hypothetical protein
MGAGLARRSGLRSPFKAGVPQWTPLSSGGGTGPRRPRVSANSLERDVSDRFLTAIRAGIPF